MVKHHYPILGAPCSGKGAIKNALQMEFGERLCAFGIGHVIRDRFKKDPDFSRRYEDRVNAGELLPDDLAIQITKTAYGQGGKNGADIYYWDGCFRTAAQAHHFIESGVITSANTTVFVLDASPETLKMRHKHRLEAMPDGARADEVSYPRRLELYNEHLPSILLLFGRSSIRVHHVNADLSLAHITDELVRYVREMDAKRDEVNKPSFPQALELTPKRRLQITRERSMALA